MREVTITTLVDNCLAHPEYTARGLLGEHGVSFLINSDELNILFDTGTSATILENAKLLGVDWGKLNAVALSHAHLDHTGGLEKVLKTTGKMRVYVHPDIFKPKYVISAEKPPRYNGMAKSLEDFQADGAEFVLREQMIEIAKNFRLIGPIVRKKASDDKRMSQRFRKEGNELVPDPLTDEQVLAIQTSQGLAIVTGCTHNGLKNTLQQVMDMTGEKKIHAVIGGLHLCHTPADKIKELAQWLQGLGIQLISCGHCTGLEATTNLIEVMGSKVEFNYVGKRITLN